MLVKSDTGPDGIMFLLIGFRTVEDGYCSVKSDIDQGTYILSNVLGTGRTRKYFVISNRMQGGADVAP